MLRQRQTLVRGPERQIGNPSFPASADVSMAIERHGSRAAMPAQVAIIARDADAVGLIMSIMSGAMPVPPAFDPMARAVDRRVQ